MTTTRIAIAGAAGGQGTTTLAAAIALRLAADGTDVSIAAHDVDALAAVIGAPAGTPEPGTLLAPRVTLVGAASGPTGVTVTDCGTLAGMLAPGQPSTALRADWRHADVRYLALRGPAYGALRSALKPADLLDLATGVVLLSEPGRSLSSADVDAVLDRPVLATVPQSDKVARAIDAGVLACRFPEQLARAVDKLRLAERVATA